MYRKVTSIFLSLIILVSFMPAFAFAGDNVDENNNENVADIVDSGECGKDGDNVIWTLYSDGTMIISGTGEMRDYGENGDKLIATPWVKYSNDIKTILIKDGVTKIGKYAFYGFEYYTEEGYGYNARYDNLSSIIFPETPLRIEEWAFSGCYHLKELPIPDSVIFIGV